MSWGLWRMCHSHSIAQLNHLESRAAQGCLLRGGELPQLCNSPEKVAHFFFFFFFFFFGGGGGEEDQPLSRQAKKKKKKSHRPNHRGAMTPPPPSSFMALPMP